MTCSPTIIFRLLSNSTTQQYHFPKDPSCTWKLVVIKDSPTFFDLFLHFFLVVAFSSSHISSCLVVPYGNDTSSSRRFLSLTQYMRDINLLCWTLMNVLFPSSLLRRAQSLNVPKSYLDVLPLRCFSPSSGLITSAMIMFLAVVVDIPHHCTIVVICMVDMLFVGTYNCSPRIGPVKVEDTG